MGNSTLATSLTGALCLGCAGYIVPAASGPSEEPRASWSVRAGAEYGSEREICRSDRELPCIVPASSEGQPISAVVSVYLYPAGENETTYRGAITAGFIGNERKPERKLEYTIKPGQRPYYVASIGRVTSTPGDYEFRIARLAEVRGPRAAPGPLKTFAFPLACLRADHAEPRDAISLHLLHELQLPVDIALHRLPRVIGALVRPRVAVDRRRHPTVDV